MIINSELDSIIPPEIRDDALYNAILELSSNAPARHILEIGSSSGAGSTDAFVRGILRSPYMPVLHCMEVSLPRFQLLEKRYSHYQQVKCHRASSVALDCFPSEKEVELFYRFIPTALNNYSLKTVLEWLRQDMEYIRASNAPENGIRQIKQSYRIDFFDMVLIDGSEFLGPKELEEVYGAAVIILDDVNGFKNYQNYKRLITDPAYFSALENLSLRNGFAIFIAR